VGGFNRAMLARITENAVKQKCHCQNRNDNDPRELLKLRLEAR
jgi:hypothetical protein